MLSEICENVRNWFCQEEDVHKGEYAVSGGSLSLPFVVNGQYFRIVGSTLNDGVYKYPVTTADALIDETFTGEIWAMKVPRSFLRLVDDIDQWQQKNGDSSPFVSESFGGGYSYSKATNGKGGAITWQDAFKSRLSIWRKL